MDKNTVREKFVRRIYRELEEYKELLLAKDRADVYKECYKAEVFSTLYEILLEKADSMSDAVLLYLLGQGTGILETIYQDWLKKEDSSYQELKEHVESETENVCFY